MRTEAEWLEVIEEQAAGLLSVRIVQDPQALGSCGIRVCFLGGSPLVSESMDFT